MMWFGYFGLIFCGLWALVNAQCPPGCQCVSTTVRCMFLQLETIPRVPSDTTLLDLRFNKISHIPSGSFEHLKKLDTLLLNNNELEAVRDGAFRGLHELRYLYLYRNKIQHIDPTTFKHLHKLEQLFLHGNNLKRLPRGLFTYNKNLKRLRLDSNALICDCELIWLAQMLRDNDAHTQAIATCDYPVSLKGRSLMSINTDEFNCNSPQADKPHITRQPTDVEVRFGNTAYFRCNAEGSPDPEIFWMHNNEVVIPSNRYSVFDDGTLMIQNAQDDDMGTYECIARNVAGEVKTDTVQLRMQKNFNEPPRFLVQPSDLQVSAGDTIDLPCTVEGRPQPVVTWIFNGANLRLTSRVSIVAGGLHIVSVRDEDRGEYRCRAENSEGVITASARLSVQTAPHFVLRPRDNSLPEGSTAVFQCDVTGEPNPIITWYKSGGPLPNNGRFQIHDSGRTLRISQVSKADMDFYTCRAENAAGRMEASAELLILAETAPIFERRVEEERAEIGSDVTLECPATAQPFPQFRWIKQGNDLRDSRKYSIDGSELTIRQVIRSDEGLYECYAENTLGFARNSIRLIVTAAVPRPGDEFVDDAIRRASQSVDNAINLTQSDLFDRRKTHSAEEMIALFRYPTAESLELARAEEVFEQTLEIIYRHVAEGHNYNLNKSDVSYKELVSPSHLALIANMSGCFRRILPQRCTNMCYHKKYRTFDGSCNNLQHPSWGTANSPLRRLLPPQYENGFNSPVGWNKARLYRGTHVPSPRLVSSVMMSTETVSTDNEDTHMVMQWGQFLDHDLTLTPQSVSRHIFNDGLRCNETCENSYPCFPIPVPPSDARVRDRSCLGFHRSSATCNTDTTSVFYKTFSPRQQLNALTAYIDASMVYGSSEETAERLRDLSHEDGHLLVGSLSREGKRLLPYDFHGLIHPADCQIEPSKRYVPCFLAGDHRANEQLGITAMHTLWMREHNRIATELSEINPHWDGNMLYHETRKIIGAMIQHISYDHWLPNIIGPYGMKMIAEYKGYDPTVDVSITNEFATAAMRFGHGIVQPIITRLNESFLPISEGNLPLHQAFFSPYRIVEEGGIDPILRGLFATGAKMKRPNELMNSELTEKLFVLANAIGQDLASLNVQRGRDHGLQFYNEYRKICNMTAAETFDDLSDHITDRNTRENLQILYGHVGNIDLFVGGMSETPYMGSAKVGMTFWCILIDQFSRLRDGDRFWYENPGVFEPDQVLQIKQSSLARVICDSSDGITHVQRDVFRMVNSRDEYVSCNDIPKMDLKMWSDCCTDCGKSGDFRSITSHFGSSRRGSELFSYQSDRPAATSEQLENFRKEIYNKQEVDIKMNNMANKMNEMQELVDHMEHAVKRMKRSMRVMMSKASPGLSCKEEDGTMRPHGAKWNKDDCTTCKCRMGKLRCKTESCPPPTCDFPKKMPGVCCMIC